MARRRGKRDEATALAHRSLECYHRVGGIPGIAAAVESLAGLAVDARPEVAARLLGGAEGLRDAQGNARARRDQARWQRERTRLRSRLGTERFTVLWAEGARLSADQLAAYALAAGEAPTGPPLDGRASLPPRERSFASSARA